MRDYLICFWKAIERTITHDGVEHAGYMSFLILLSLFPFIVFFLALASFLGASELGSYFVDFLLQNLPENATDSIKNTIYDLVKAPPTSLMTLAIFGTIWTSSSFVEGLRTILNRVYHVSIPPPYLFRRLLSIVQFLIINMIIFIVMFLLIIVPSAISKFPNISIIIDNYLLFSDYLKYFLIWVAMFCMVSSFYFIIPNKKIKFVQVVPGTIVTILLWAASGKLLSNYLTYYRQFSLIYGSLGSIIITMLFFYIVSIIFIYGAELNYHLSHKKP